MKAKPGMNVSSLLSKDVELRNVPVNLHRDVFLQAQDYRIS